MVEENKNEEKKDISGDAQNIDWEVKAAEYLAGWQRAKADYLNYKKDEVRRFEETIKFSGELFIRELINVLDSFDLSLIALESESKAQKGMYLIKSQLEDILKKFGLEKIAVSVGQKFDPVFHESVVEIESSQPSGTVVEEIEAGYTLHGKVIRPSRVKLAK
ncbi:MAG: nucleotide exchange factor GrpE [Candidatus Brennerbacteria bacterium]|nr:nucleotide exchange factor GrpE [Candidatus Brennerbacteria bacterium]